MTRIIPRAAFGFLAAAVFFSLFSPPASADKGYAEFSLWNRSQFYRDPLNTMPNGYETIFSFSAVQEITNFGTFSLQTDGLFGNGDFRVSRLNALWEGFKFKEITLTLAAGDGDLVNTNLESRFINEFHPYFYFRGASAQFAASHFDLVFVGGKIAEMGGLLGTTYDIKDQPFTGLRGRWKFGPGGIIGASIFHTRKDPADTLSAEKNTLVSADGEAEVIPGVKLLGEFAASLTPGEAGPAGSADSVRLGPIVHAGKWDVEANYRFIGSRFQDLNPDSQFIHDERGLFSSVRYQLSRGLTLFAVADRFTNNTDADPAVNTLKSFALASGFYLNTRSLFDLSAQWETQRRVSDDPSANGSDFFSSALFVQTSRTMGEYFPYLRIRLEYAREKAGIASHDWTPSVFLGVRRILPSGDFLWLEGQYDQKADEADGILDRNIVVRSGWNKNFSPNFNLYSELSYERSGVENAISRLVAYVSARLGLGKAIDLNVDFRAAEPLNRRGIQASDYQFTLRFSKRFSWGREGRVLGRKTFKGMVGTGTIDGFVYEDADGDGVPGLGEKGLSGVTVRLEDGSKTATGPDGRYRFENVAEGPHQIRVEESGIPAVYYLLGPVRIDVLLQPRVTRQVLFPLISGGNASGRFINDADRNGRADPEEKGISDLLVILTPVEGNVPSAPSAESKTAENQAIVENTYTGADGTFRFVNVFPGEYDLSIDPTTLPEGATPAATFPLRVKIAPGGNVTGLDFLITPRPVIRKK